MRTYKSIKGPFSERPFFSDSEIEDLCCEELKKVNLLPQVPGVIRIDRFIEKRFGVSPVYDELPPGVLGFTRFNAKGVEEVVVSRKLGEEDSIPSRRRINSTLAHEAGHGLLHAYLFVVSSQAQQLFGNDFDSKTPRILCRDENLEQRKSSYDGRWWEFQANKTIGALLLPKPLVMQILSMFSKPLGLLGVPQLPTNKRGRVIQELTTKFDVNPAVAKIRLDTLVPNQGSGQLSF
jgi:hypothetical protein